MNQDLTEIVMVVDRSGSMSSCRADAEGGINSFVKEQQGQPGRANFTLVQFDTTYDFVHNGVPIQDVPEFKLVPRGNTALYDAVGRAIDETGIRLAAMPEEQRPGLVIMVIVTDGGENSSKEYTQSRVRDMVKHQSENYQWQFTYLGANQDAFLVGKSLGVAAASIANYSTTVADAAFASASKNVTRMRETKTSGGIVLSSYTAAERDAMSGQGDAAWASHSSTKSST